jgi:ATP-dependent RNA helicase SUPV3L1/SUV3
LLGDAEHADFALDTTGTVSWRGQVVARLTRGTDLVHPQVKLVGNAPLGAGARLRAERRLGAWTRDLVAELVGALRRPEAGTLSAAARGLVYQLEQGLGTVSSRAARAELALLGPEDRRVLGRLGVSLGPSVVHLPSALDPRSLVIRQALATVWRGEPSPLGADPPPSLIADPAVPTDHYRELGYLVLGRRAIRADLVERVERRLARPSEQAPAHLSAELGRWLDCPVRELARILGPLGYRRRPDGSFTRTRARRRRARRAVRARPAVK